ncbi:MAG: hypothetical protein ABR582_10745 [Gemmatimonadaceae bacterium]
MTRTFFVAALLFAMSSAGAQTNSQPADTGYVQYREPWITLPLGVGLRLPAYDRVDGLSVPWGPEISFAEEHVVIDPTVTYRSHIGKFDPFLKAMLRSRNGVILDIKGGRSTFTNDDWIRTDLVNTLAAIAVGSDSRNYFRADRGTGILSLEIGRPNITITPGVGINFENDWSVGVPVRHTNAPWSLFSKTDTLKMRRTNPSIWEGHLASMLGRVLGEYEAGGVKGSFSGLLERSFKTPPRRSTTGFLLASEDFTQVTLNAKVGFPTFRTQRFDFRGHGVFTSSDATPPQRFAYLGGAGTLATVDLLALGGDKLFFVNGEYSIPIEGIDLPLARNPIVSLMYSAGSAGVDELPDFIQNLGVGLGFSMIKVEYHIDPNYKKTSFTHKHAFSVSLNLEM